ncbi:MAG: DUF3159 domain-containing protein [Sciscionella sp.]
MTEPAEPETGNGEHADAEEPQPTLLEQMGGLGGLVYSAVPVLVFVLAYSAFGLTAGIWSSIGVALGITVLRLVRREPLQPAVSGLFGVAIAAFIAYRTGSAKGYFLFGIWINLVYCAAFLLSAVVRWPLAGVLWATLNGTGMGWRSDRVARRYYDVATLVWILVFGAKFVVQHWLYDADQVGWLAFARIAMGYPLAAVAVLVTIWAVRKADLRQKELAPADPSSAT